MTVNVIYNLVISIFLLIYGHFQNKKLTEKLKHDFYYFRLFFKINAIVNIIMFIIALVK